MKRSGFLVPIGGAEAKSGDAAILRRFAEMCGGRRARIAIIPTASRERDSGQRYEGIFGELGVARAQALLFRSRADCASRDLLGPLQDATGVFLTGGSQTRLMRVVGGTPVASVITELFAGGVHVAGTSAGAAFLSERMIAFGESGETPRRGMVALRAGLGLTRELIVDQHFRQRDRLGRLLTALATHPDRVGLGLDEDTAAIVSADGMLEIIGSGSATIIDPSTMRVRSGDTRAGAALELTGARLHVLTAGGTYNVATRHAVPSNGG